jgi:hypothetical protein
MENMARKIKEDCEKWGLTINLNKKICMYVWEKEEKF